MTTERPNSKYDARPDLKYCSILLRRAAVSAMNIILGCLNLITSIPQKNLNQSVDSSQPVIAGDQKSSAPKSANAEYYVRTATGSTHLSSRTTMRTPKSETHCERSIIHTELNPEKCAEIREGLIKGTLDLRTISMATWLHVSYLTLFAKQETHMEQAIVYNGNVYNLHVCVAGVVPPAPSEKLKEKQ